MATQETPPSKTLSKPVNWSLQAHQRVLALWNVVAMSLDVEPKLASITLAKRDEVFAASFEERKQLLGRKLSSEPDENHVTYFPRHGFNDSKTGYSNRMVDVVSCIKILKPIYRDALPKEFLALETTLELVALPKQHSPTSNLVVISAAVVAPTSEAKPKKPATTRGASIEHNSLHMLLYGMACSGYGYKENMRSEEKVTVAKTIASDVPVPFRNRYGLTYSKVLKILKVGYSLLSAPE